MRRLIPTGVTSRPVEFAQDTQPAPAPDEVLIKIEAFSPNRGETFLLEAPEPGLMPGKDVAGLVVQAAADGSGPPAGSRVVGHPPMGGWAEYAAVPTHSIAVLPDALATVQAAALPLAGITALRLLRTVGAVTGRRVLLTGASGGVGHYLTEFAAAARAEVTAVTATAERGARLRELGAAAAVTVSGPFRLYWDALPPPVQDLLIQRAGGEETARRFAGQVDLSTLAPQITCPLLVVDGGQDVIPGVTNGEPLARLAPHGHYLYLPHGDHLLGNARPDWLAAAADWISGALA
ncbi:alcohol dehydrogenase catalytic domain-containing protein [Streptosporangium roseum]|uniref:alcohol dehydrogenase catalytic domain-containing protein n=1 Tax=Streptosporangium roseum TaxID=2001 RepID=UPI0033190E1A